MENIVNYSKKFKIKLFFSISSYWKDISTVQMGFDTDAERIIYSVLQRGMICRELNSDSPLENS